MTIQQRISIFITLLILAVFTPQTFAGSQTTTAKSQNQAALEQKAADSAKVNINTADAETLAKMLKGVGLVKAKAIISFREQNGPFATADDLTQVKGIGPATVKKNAEVIIVK